MFAMLVQTLLHLNIACACLHFVHCVDTYTQEHANMYLRDNFRSRARSMHCTVPHAQCSNANVCITVLAKVSPVVQSRDYRQPLSPSCLV